MVSVGKPSNNQTRATKKKKKSYTGTAVGVCVVIVAVIAFAMLVLPNGDDSGLKPQNDPPLDGTFTLTGSTVSNGTQYYAVATFVFDNGKLSSQNVDTTANKNDLPSSIKIHTNSVNYIEPYHASSTGPVRGPNEMTTVDSLVYHNPFLKDMTSVGTKNIKVDGTSTTGYGFEDSSGNTYYLDHDGRLIAYSFLKYGVSYLAVLSQWN